MSSFSSRAWSAYSIDCALSLLSVQVQYHSLKTWFKTKSFMQAPSHAQLNSHVHFGCCLNPILSPPARLRLTVSRGCTFAPMWATTMLTCLSAPEWKWLLLTLSIVTILSPPCLSCHSNLQAYQGSALVQIMPSVAAVVWYSQDDDLWRNLSPCPQRPHSYRSLGWDSAGLFIRFVPAYLPGTPVASDYSAPP